MKHYPKVRIYVLKRQAVTLEMHWQYQGSTTHFPSKDAALQGYIRRNRNVVARDARAEFAATHGYYIEVE